MCNPTYLCTYPKVQASGQPPRRNHEGRRRAGVVWCGVLWCGVLWCGLVWFGLVIPKAGAYEGEVVWRARGIASRRIAGYRQLHPTRGHTEPHPHLTGLTALQPLNKWAEQPLLHLHSSVELLRTPARLNTPDSDSGPSGSRDGNTEYHPQRSDAIPVIRLEERPVLPSTRTLV